MRERRRGEGKKKRNSSEMRDGTTKSGVINQDLGNYRTVNLSSDQICDSGGLALPSSLNKLKPEAEGLAKV